MLLVLHEHISFFDIIGIQTVIIASGHIMIGCCCSLSDSRRGSAQIISFMLASRSIRDKAPRWIVYYASSAIAKY